MITLAPVSDCMIYCQLVSTLCQRTVRHHSKLNLECLLNYNYNFDYELKLNWGTKEAELK